MQEQTLSELWSSLDVKARADLLQVVADELFVGADTFRAWRCGARRIPRAKQPRLEAIVKRQYNILIKPQNNGNDTTTSANAH